MINLLTETQPWEERQIRKRGETLVRAHFNQDVEFILNRKLQGAALGQYTLTADEQAQVAEFNAVSSQAREDVIKALVDNELLKEVLAYEQAERTVATTSLFIDGRDEVVEVPEQRDPDTGEVIVEYVAPVSAVEPVQRTYQWTNEEGEIISSPYPAYVQAVAERDAAEALISAAAPEVVALVAQRGEQ